ncbi:hypothetical protein WDW37_06405 [Bdellovibrionota bacterium FG-1]
MNRNSKILGTAITLAALSLICLEAIHADEAPPTAPLIPGKILITITTDKDGSTPQKLHQFSLNVITNEANEIQGIFYFEKGRERMPCIKRVSLQNCIIPLSDIGKEGAVLERAINPMSRTRFDVITLKITSPIDLATSSGTVTIHYLAQAISALDPTQADVYGDFDITLGKVDGAWKAFLPVTDKAKTPTLINNLFMETLFFPFGHYAIGIKQVNPS